MMKKTTIVLVLNKQAARRRSGQYLVHELDCPWHGPAMLVHGGAGGHERAGRSEPGRARWRARRLQRRGPPSGRRCDAG
jgi:hypothetical protein